MVTASQIIATLLPWSIFITGKLYSVKDSGSDISWRPSPAVFGIVWTILALCIIASWLIALRRNVDVYLVNALFIATILCANIWLIAYSKDRKYGVTVLIFMLFFILPLIMMLYGTGNIYSAMLLAPLFIWITIALVMNIISS